MASSSNLKEILVFARTNLGTRIVIAVSPDTTAGDFKGVFERAHLNCFQELGRIKVYGLKVKKKSCFYNLPESFPLKHVSENLKNHLLHIEVYHLKNQSGPAETKGSEICNHIFDPKDVPNTKEAQKFVATGTNNRISNRRGKRRREMNTAVKNPVHPFQQGPNFSGFTVSQFAYNSAADGNYAKEVDDSPEKECSSEIISESISVSNIIQRYFTDYDEVSLTSSSRFSDMALPTLNKEFAMSFPPMVGASPQILQPQSLDQHCTKSSRGTNGKNIGTCLRAAADNIRVQLDKKSPILSLCKYRNMNPLLPTPMKDLVFNEGD